MLRKTCTLLIVTCFLVAFAGFSKPVEAAPVVTILNSTLCGFTYTAVDAAGFTYGPFFTVPGQVDTFIIPGGVPLFGIIIGGGFFLAPPPGGCTPLPFVCPTAFCDLGGCNYSFF